MVGAHVMGRSDGMPLDGWSKTARKVAAFVRDVQAHDPDITIGDIEPFLVISPEAPAAVAQCVQGCGRVAVRR